METLVNDILTGAVCEICNQYFIKERNIDGADVPTVFTHGHPAVCHGCYETIPKNDREKYVKAETNVV